MNKGFTLIELVVAIIVVALLASIVLPSLSAAKGIANQTACASNLRNMTLAVCLYAQENRNWLPTAEPPGREFPDNRHWFMNADLLENMGTHFLKAGNGAPLGPPEDGTILICPTHENPRLWRDGTVPAYGLSYGMNGTWGLGGRPDHLKRRRVDQFMDVSGAMVFMDARGVKAAPGIVLYKGCPKGNIDFRHRGKANAAFLDGHVESVAEKDVPFGMENRFKPFWSAKKP